MAWGYYLLQFKEGENAKSLGLDGTEVYDLLDISELQPAGELKIVAQKEDGSEKTFQVIARLNSFIEVEYFRNGGILHRFLREKIKGN